MDRPEAGESEAREGYEHGPDQDIRAERPPNPFLDFQRDRFFSRFAFIATQPSSSSSSELLPLLGSAVGAGVEFRGSFQELKAPDMVETRRIASCGACDTGRYRPGKPILLRSEGAIDGA